MFKVSDCQSNRDGCLATNRDRVSGIPITIRSIANEKPRMKTKAEPEYTRDQTRYEQREGIRLQGQSGLYFPVPPIPDFTAFARAIDGQHTNFQLGAVRRLSNVSS